MTWEDRAYFAHAFSLYIGSLWQLDEGEQTGGTGGEHQPQRSSSCIKLGICLGVNGKVGNFLHIFYITDCKRLPRRYNSVHYFTTHARQEG